jgi:hypothetical protein
MKTFYDFLFRPRAICYLILICAFLALCSCRQSVQRRPAGDFRLGKVIDLLAPETEMQKLKLLLRRDEKGFYVMSTMCTYDSTYLVRKKEGDREIYLSTYTDSKYELDGKVISGPAIADLPYYKLKYAAGSYESPIDTLFAEVGREVPRDWRLAVPIKAP